MTKNKRSDQENLLDKLGRYRTTILVATFVCFLIGYFYSTHLIDARVDIKIVVLSFLTAIFVELIGALIGITFLDGLSRDDTILRLNQIISKLDEQEGIQNTIRQLSELDNLLKIQIDSDTIQQVKDLHFAKTAINKQQNAIAILGDRTNHILAELKESFAEGRVNFYSEPERKLAIVAMYDQFGKLYKTRPDDLEILAVTWDIYDYFINYWGEDDIKQYINRNKKVAELGVTIKRIFIVNENNFDNAKRRKLNKIFEQTSHHKIETKWIYEHQIRSVNVLNHKSSFLLVGSHTKYDIFTESIGTSNNRLFMHFNAGRIAAGAASRFQELYEIEGNPYPIPII